MPTGRARGALPSRARLPLGSRLLLLCRPLGGRQGFETLVRDRLSALDRPAICAGGKALLGPLHRGEPLPQIVCETLVELCHVEICGEVRGIELVRLLAVVLVPAAGERPLDPLPLGREELARAFVVHRSTLSRRGSATRASRRARSTARSRRPRDRGDPVIERLSVARRRCVTRSSNVRCGACGRSPS